MSRAFVRLMQALLAGNPDTLPCLLRAAGVRQAKPLHAEMCRTYTLTLVVSLLEGILC